MHLLTDENGNPIPHGHAHGNEDHPHSHDTQDPCDTCELHGADGAPCGEQNTENCPANGGHKAPETKDQMAAVLDYMLKHNQHHAAELDGIAAKLAAAGNEEAAEQIRKAVDEFQKGNLYLSLALATVKESAK